MRKITMIPFFVMLSSVLLIISFPDFNLWLFAWVGLVPLFFAIDGQKPLKAFMTAYFIGALFFLGTVYWLIHVTLPGMAAAALYLAVYFGIFGLTISFAINRPSYLSLFTVPSVWVALEYARSNIFSGFGWNLLAHSQSSNLIMIQIADITGSYGVSYLIVLVNTAVFFAIKSARKRKYSTFYPAIAIVIVFFAAGYGILRLNNIFTGMPLKVAVVQGNIAQHEKWDSRFQRMIIDKYETLTAASAKESPDLIVWPETSVPGFFSEGGDLQRRISVLARKANAALLVGEPRQDTGDEDLYYNSATLFDRSGKEVAVYDKIHLVPFGEFIPARNLFSFVEKFTKSTIGDFSAGKEYTVFNFIVERNQKGETYSQRLIKKVRFSVLICFEDIFPEIARQFVKKGANFLVNITNDAWFGNTCAPYQHVQNSVYRAVENRVNVIRSANTGLSCFIDQKGRVFGTVTSGGKSIFVDGYRTEDIMLTNTRTFYTVYGDFFAYLCILIAALYVLAIAGIQAKSARRP
ncbi:MAG: apolipoprotein N-acyltransferase [Candidatus Omnitrophica bacterium]|nr:apolipoprotein N-acyltransferase [Candidatus Omnitrophota bacterium]